MREDHREFGDKSRMWHSACIWERWKEIQQVNDKKNIEF